MNRRFAGVAFCFISACLFAARYITAAIYGSSNNTAWGHKLFDGLLDYVGNDLTIASIFALVIGMIYLILAEKGE